VKVKLGTTAFYTSLTTTVAGYVFDVTIANTAEAVQVAFATGSTAAVAGAVDTAEGVTFSITGQLETTSETLTLVDYTVELIR
jgi:hypothetical protein